MKMRKVFVIGIAIALCLSLLCVSGAAAASEDEERNRIDTASIDVDMNQMSPEVKEHFEYLTRGIRGVKEGEFKESTVFDDGTILYVTVIDEEDT